MDIVSMLQLIGDSLSIVAFATVTGLHISEYFEDYNYDNAICHKGGTRLGPKQAFE